MTRASLERAPTGCVVRRFFKKSELNIRQEIEFENNKHFWSRNSELRGWAKNAVKDASARNWRYGTLGVNLHRFFYYFLTLPTNRAQENGEILGFGPVFWGKNLQVSLKYIFRIFCCKVSFKSKIYHRMSALLKCF